MKIKRLLFILIVLLVTGCTKQTDETSRPMIVLCEARNKEAHYLKYSDGDRVFIKNQETDNILSTRKCYETLKKALVLPAPVQDTDEADVRMYDNRSSLSPYTYATTLEEAARYMHALTDSGWTLQAKYVNSSYMDLYLVHSEAWLRVIILENKIKILPDISGEDLPDPLTFIEGE